MMMFKKYSIVFILSMSLVPLWGYAQEEGDIITDEILVDESREIPQDIPNSTGEEYSTPDSFYRARVEGIETNTSQVLGQEQKTQILTLRILNKEKKDEIIVVDNGGGVDLQESQIYKEGDVLVVVKTLVGENEEYYVQDRYRLPGLIGMVVFFLVLAIIFARKQGLGSIIGLIASVGVLVGYLVPALLAGQNPIMVTFISVFSIIVLTLFISHGFRLRTMIAFVSMNITLAVAYALSTLFVYWAQMFGVGSEETFYLASVIDGDINLRGILLAGIMIGMLGVLDDVTVAQAGTIDEIKRANSKATFKQLYQAGMSVGRDHIASLVNTLALAYVGSSLPFFLLIYMNSANVPLWVTLNSEFIAQELVRTVAGSIAIVLAVPITSLIAAKVFSTYKHKPRKDDGKEHIHVHGHSH